jgi:D-ribose pyranase
MAREFHEHNSPTVHERFALALEGLTPTFLPHAELKQRVPSAIGLIRTGDTIAYANMILVSA